MKTEAGVRQIAAGGLPVTGPMQSVSGSRGSEVMQIVQTDSLANGLRGLETNRSGHSDPDLPPSSKNNRFFARGGGFNVRDQIRRNSEDPLQFIYEAADCRIFYTAPMITDYTVLWTRAADAMWKNSSLCVEDSTGNPTSGNETSLDAPPTSSGSAPPSSTSNSGAVTFGGGRAQGYLSAMIVVVMAGLLVL